MSLAAVFPDYYDDGFARRLEPGPRWFVVLFVSGVVVAGLLLLAHGTGFDRGFDRVEGTWVMLVGGLLLAVFTLVRFAAPPEPTPAPGEHPVSP